MFVFKAGKIARSQTAVFIGLCITACGLALADARIIRQARRQATPAQLGMTTESLNDAIALKWNAASPAISSADSADLLIDDGQHHARLVLLREQLAAGFLEYAPFSNDVRVRLIAHGADGRTAFESVRVVANEWTGSADRIAPARSTRGHEGGTVTLRVISREVKP